MLKDYGIIKRIGSAMGHAAEQSAAEVLGDYQQLDGREEEITSQLRGQINRTLLDSARRILDAEDFPNCTVSVATFKKKEESYTGADLAGVFEMRFNGTTISKAYLAQSKLAKEYTDSNGQKYLVARNKDVVAQSVKMLETTSDSFVFLYSKSGITCIPAFQVALSGSSTIDTRSFAYRSFSSFYEEFVKCFIGDHLISPRAMHATSLEDYTRKLSADAALRITVDFDRRVKVKERSKT